MTDGQLIQLWLTHRYRGQAPLHMGCVVSLVEGMALVPQPVAECLVFQGIPAPARFPHQFLVAQGIVQAWMVWVPGTTSLPISSSALLTAVRVLSVNGAKGSLF